MSFSHPGLKPRLLFSTLQILTPGLRCLIFILFFFKQMFSWMWNKYFWVNVLFLRCLCSWLWGLWAGLAASSTSAVTGVLCWPSPGYCWNFIPPLSVAHAKLVKATCVLPSYVRDTSSGVETGKWGGLWGRWEGAGVHPCGARVWMRRKEMRGEGRHSLLC